MPAKRRLAALVLCLAVIACPFSLAMGGLDDGFTFLAWDLGPSPWWTVNLWTVAIGGLTLLILLIWRTN